MKVSKMRESRLLINPHGVEGAGHFLGNPANMDLICQAKRELGQAPVPTPTLETNMIFISATLFLLGIVT